MPSTYNGIGTTFLGEAQYRSDGSFITTEFVTVLWIPLIPLRSYRVTVERKDKRLFGMPIQGDTLLYTVREQIGRPDWPQVTRVYVTTASVLLSVHLAWLYTTGRTPLDASTLSPQWKFFIPLVAFAWPLLATAVVRWRARRRIRSQEGGEPSLN